MKRALKIVEISALLLFSSFLILGIYAIKTFKLDFPVSTASERSRSAEIARNIDAMKQGLEKGTVPWRRVDTSSIGFPQKEATLLNLQSEMDYFVLTFGHNPTDIAELSRLSEVPDYPAEKRRTVPVLRKICEIINLDADSYILSCDNFSSLEASEREKFLESFDKETVKFYEIHGHIILYAPPPVLGRPPSPTKSAGATHQTGRQ